MNWMLNFRLGGKHLSVFICAEEKLQSDKGTYILLASLLV